MVQHSKGGHSDMEDAGRKCYKALERHFWKSVTMNPPLYGADTPMSLFGSHCKGWALTDLGDLLKQKGVPEIPGVTTPMSYFGMWKVRRALLALRCAHFIITVGR
jgi:hypothetical protein